MTGRSAKLVVRLRPGGYGRGTFGVVVCDAAGLPLANQRSVAVEQRSGQPTVVTVEFVVDGDRVRLELEPREAAP